MNPQKRYQDAEVLALETALENVQELMKGADPKRAFARTFDSGFMLGFETCRLMAREGLDIEEVDTTASPLPGVED